MNKEDWTVVIEQEAVRQARGEIEGLYHGVERADRLGWLDRLLADLAKTPFKVLGYPPRQAASDSDLLYFPGDPKSKVSAIAYASKKNRVIQIYRIVVQKPLKGVQS